MTDIPPVPTPENESASTPPVVMTPPAKVANSVPTPPVSGDNKEPEPVVPQKADQKEEKEEKKVSSSTPKKSGMQVFIAFIAILLGLIAVSYVFILWSLVEGNFSDPQFAQLLEMVGMTPAELKDKFTLITHVLFGGFSFIFLIATLVKFFQWLMTSSSSVYRKTHIRKMGVFMVILLFLIGMWIGVVWIISRAEASPPVATGSTDPLITTQPTSVIGLTAPISVEFNLGNKLFEKIPRELVKEIRWDFDGDGEIDASEAIVTNRFLDRGKNNGRYQVKVEVVYFSPSVNEERTYSETKEVIISNVAVEAVMKATPEVGSVPLTVKFSGEESNDLDGDIVQYEWDLDGDGEFETRGVNEKEIEKIFYKIGEHTVRLRVTGQNHDFSIAEKVITVVAAEEKIRAEIVSPDSDFEGTAPLSITFDGARSYTRSGKIVKYEWRVDNAEKTFIGRKMQRVFDTPGEYEVLLTVENEDGDRDEITQTVSVVPLRNMKILTSPVVNEDGILEGKTPLEVTFDASKSEIPHAIEWHWDFNGDGIVDEFAEKASYIFRVPGTYAVELTIVDADDKEFTTKQKVVVEKLGVVAKISALPASGSVPLTVDFDGSGSQTSEGEIIDYIWTFPGEDPIHYNGKISREFRQVGVFPVKLEILTSSGVRATTEMFISVRGKVLAAAFNAAPSAGAAPLTVQFSPTESTGDVRSYFWKFSDGSVSTDPYPKHTFTYAGEFPVTLKLTDSRGLVSEITKIVTVTTDK
jgi:PKD repeat protein